MMAEQKKKKRTTRSETAAKPLAHATSQERRKVDYQLLQPISQSAKLIEIQPLRFEAAALRPLRELNVNLLGERIEYRAVRHEATPDVIFSFVDYKYEALDGEEVVATAGGQVAVIYAIRTGSTTEFDSAQLDIFAVINGLYNSWSYVRELIGSSLARVGLAGVLIPVWHAPASLPADPMEYMRIVRSAPGTIANAPKTPRKN